MSTKNLKHNHKEKIVCVPEPQLKRYHNMVTYETTKV